MAFVVTVNMGGNAVPGLANVETGLNKATAAAKQTQAAVDATGAAATRAGGQARDAMGRYTAGANAAAAASTNAGAAAQAAGAKAASGHNAAKQAADGHGDSITRLIHLAEAYFAVHQFETLVDGYIEVRNKINAVSESHDNLNGLMDETFRIAQETRSEWGEIGAAYQRIAQATRGLGLSQKESLALTEELSMGMRLSGSSSREASMTMQELTHALTTGTLTGREFKVMMKDAPALMHELQVVSGHAGNEFSEMGKKGKLTGQVLVDLFTKAGPAIKEKFADTLPTISEGFAMIRNAAERFFGSAAVGTGVMGTLSSAIKFIADHFDAFGKTALGVGEALIGLFVIEKIIVMVKALTVAIAANPLGLLLTAVVVGISLLRQFGESLDTNVKVWKNVDGVFVTVKDDLNALWIQLKKLGSEILTFVKEAWGALAKAFSDGLPTTGIDFSLHGALRLVSGFVGAVRGLFQVLGEDSNKTFALMAYTLVDVMTQALNALMAGFGKMFGTMRHEVFNFLNKDLNDAQLKASKAAADEQAKEDERSGRNAKVLQAAKESLGYDSSDPSYHAKEIEAEYKKRLASDYRSSLINEYAQRGLDEEGHDLREGRTKIGHIDNPLEGTGIAALAHEAIGDIKNNAKAAMDDFDRAAREIAAARVQDTKTSGYVSSVRGKADEKPHEDTHGLEKLKNELRAILEQTNPVVAAQEKLAHAQDILTKATQTYDPVAKKMLLTQVEARDAMDNYRRKLEDALHPHDAWVRKQIDAMAALKNTAEATQDAAKAQQYLDYAKEKGIIVTEMQIAQVHRLAVAEREHAAAMHAQQSITESINGPLKTYQIGIKAAADLLQNGTINAEQYGRVTDDLRASLLASTPEGKTFIGGLEAQWLKAKLEAESFGATVAGMVVSDVEKLNEALVTMANSGEVAWGKMIDAMIQDLERLILKQLEVAAINAIIGAVVGAPVPGAGEAVVGTTSSNLNSPAYTAASGTAGSAASTRQQPVIMHTHVHNHYEKSTVLAAIDSPEGDKVIVNRMRANGRSASAR